MQAGYDVPYVALPKPPPLKNTLSYFVQEFPGTSFFSKKALVQLDGIPTARPDPKKGAYWDEPFPRYTLADDTLTQSDLEAEGDMFWVTVPPYGGRLKGDKITVYVYLNGWDFDDHHKKKAIHCVDSYIDTDLNEAACFYVSMSGQYFADYASFQGKKGEFFIDYRVNDFRWSHPWRRRIDT